MKKFFTSESVTEGHPDKLCDAISDAAVDAILAQDPYARCAIECCAAYDGLLIMGEVTANADVKFEEIAKQTIKRIGYDFGSFSYENVNITVSVHGQSPDIAQGVDKPLEEREGNTEDKNELGAGDQGMMFGYACSETEELMPLPLTLAHKLSARLTEVRKNKLLPFLRPDGKTQVTVEYDGETPKRIEAIVVSSQHDESVTQEELKAQIIKNVINYVVPANLMDGNTRIYVNPTGRFLIGGPEGDSGLTGRKIIVDTYGGACAHGGGAFSGKDPTKVDRSAAYMARYICKNAVAAGLCDKIELQVAYAIGVARPVSVFVNTFGTGKLSDGEIADILVKEFDMRPYGIISTLKLRQPIYSQTAAYGHFGKPYLPWEQCDKADDLKKYLK
ncbi:MAG: methionine adenosyltransferase [Clostridia bacterium]|nr:methionine adenosyltransferase [Clostridia bacterium]